MPNDYLGGDFAKNLKGKLAPKKKGFVNNK